MPCWPEEGSLLPLGGWRERCARLASLWRRNWRIGWPERARGLHYWLGFEYAGMLEGVRARPNERWLDVGTGAWSSWPYLLADTTGVQVVAVDIDAGIHLQTDRRRRAAAAGLRRAADVQLVRGDGRALPFADASFDGVTAVSSLEHVQGRVGDRQALGEIARVLRPGGQALVSVPLRAEGSAVELDDELSLYQRHYSLRTFRTSMLEPSGLQPSRRVFYGERLPFYALTRSLPAGLDRLRRPWDTIVTMALLRPTGDPARASAMLVDLRKA